MAGVEIRKKPEPKIRITYKNMEAYLTLPKLPDNENYTLNEVTTLLEKSGVRYGVDFDVIETMIENRLFGREMLIAEGEEAVDGIDGYYDFNFDSNFSRKPKINEDGSVDYWSVHLIELVEEGQLLATYHEPVDCKNGMDVKGKPLMAKRGRPQLPLVGRGFERGADGKTYYATISGKIEKQKNRIIILPVYEIYGDAGLSVGNIDFKGDVIIHGNVKPGCRIRATSSITIDGTAEACFLEAGKDIILRGGMIGGEKAIIKTKGNLFAKFIEYSTVEAEGFIEADSALNSTIVSYDRVVFNAGTSSVIGGSVYGCSGIEAKNIGNDTEIKTELFVGVHKKIRQKVFFVQKELDEAKDMIYKIDIGLKQLEEVAELENIDLSNDERKMSLLRTKIAKQAEISIKEQEVTHLLEIIDKSESATVKALKNVYGGVEVSINDSKAVVSRRQQMVEFIERNGKVVMMSIL